MSAHVIHFVGPIIQQTFTQLQNIALSAVTQHGATELHLYLSTEGGNTNIGFTAYNFLKSLPVPVTTYNTGNVESMGIILYLAGEKRYTSPHSRFLLHPLNWSFAANTMIDHARLNEISASLDNDLERYISIFDERTNSGSGKIEIRSALRGSHQILDADGALTSGIATEISETPTIKDAVTWWINL